MISKQKEIFNELAHKNLKEITELDEKVNLDDLVYRYKGRSHDEKFDKYDNALYIINKIRNGEIKLAKAKNDQIRFKSYLGEIKKGKKELKTHYAILKCFAKQKKELLNFMMIVL